MRITSIRAQNRGDSMNLPSHYSIRGTKESGQGAFLPDWIATETDLISDTTRIPALELSGFNRSCEKSRWSNRLCRRDSPALRHRHSTLILNWRTRATGLGCWCNGRAEHLPVHGRHSLFCSFELLQTRCEGGRTRFPDGCLPFPVVWWNQDIPERSGNRRYVDIVEL